MEQEDVFFRKLGILTHNQSKIEFQLSGWIIKLLDNDGFIGMIVTAEMSYRNLMNCLSSILVYKKDDDKYITENYEIILKLISRIHTIENERNILVHSIYEFENNTITRQKFIAKTKGLKVTEEKVNLNEIDLLIDKQYDAISNITRAMYEENIILE